jgi:hypothetical protein
MIKIIFNKNEINFLLTNFKYPPAHPFPVIISMTPLLLRNRLKFPLNFRSHFTSKEIISVENKKLQNPVDSAPSFLPPSNFPYDYKPMSIFEEQMGTSGFSKKTLIYYVLFCFVLF